MSHMDEGTLHSWLDGELAEEEAAQLREHLTTCADCRSQVDAARATRNRAHEILRLADPEGIVPPDFAALQRRRSAALREPATRSTVRPLLLPWAASVVLALGAGWFAQEILRGGDDGTAMERVAAVQSETAPGAPAPPPSAASPGSGSMAVSAYDAGPDERVQAESTPPEAGPVPMAARPRASSSVAADGAEAREATEASAEAAAAPPAADADGTDMALSPASPSRVLSWAGPWTETDRGAAERVLGAEPLAIADLSIESYAVAADGSPAVRVIQRLPGGEPLQILLRRVQQFAPAAADADAPATGGAGEAGTMRRGTSPPSNSLEIILQAEIPADSLERLRDAIQ